MTAHDLLDDLHRRGMAVHVDGEQIRVDGAETLTDTDRAAIRDHKPELLKLLAANDADGARPRVYSGMPLLDWVAAGCPRIQRQRSDPSAESVLAEGRPVEPGAGVRCGDCRHQQRTDHPHLVDCAAGVVSSNATRLHWDTAIHQCEQFTQRDEP